MRTFLLETSILDRLCGPLCDAVPGRAGRPAAAGAVERANLFLIPLDDERRWWRYHHLFADLLRANLHGQFPQRVPELHRAAATWYSDHGLPDDAIRHALAAGDTARAAELVEEHLEEQVWRRAQGATIAVWLAALPAEEIHRRPLLTLGQAVASLMAGRLDAVEPLLAVAERALERARRGRTAHRSTAGSACWRTSRRASRSAAPIWRACAATPPPSRSSPAPRSPT